MILNSLGIHTQTLSFFKLRQGDVWEVRNAIVWVTNDHAELNVGSLVLLISGHIASIFRFDLVGYNAVFHAVLRPRITLSTLLFSVVLIIWNQLQKNEVHLKFMNMILNIKEKREISWKVNAHKLSSAYPLNANLHASHRRQFRSRYHRLCGIKQVLFMGV